MLSLLWWLPLAVAATAVVALGRAAQELVTEVARTRASISDLQRVRPLVAEVKAEIDAVAPAPRGVHDLGHR